MTKVFFCILTSALLTFPVCFGVQDKFMKTQRIALIVIMFAAFFVNLTPAWGVSKEIIELASRSDDAHDDIVQ